MIYRLTENDVNAMIAEAAVRILESRSLLREMDWDEQWKEFTEDHPEEYKDPKTRMFKGEKSGQHKKDKKSSNPSDEDNSGQENLTNTKGGKDDKDELLQPGTVAGAVRDYLKSIGSKMNPDMDADALPPPQPPAPPMMPGAPMPGAPMPM